MSLFPNVERAHAHPCNFRLARVLDRGWGEMAFEYHWDSTTGLKEEEGLGCPDLNACALYEYTTYPHNAGHDATEESDASSPHTGRYANGWYYPPDPPFAQWKFRDPTDGRTAPVALGCFAATQGWAWDRHKTGGRLLPPLHLTPRIFTIAATQEYRFHCSVCGMDSRIPGSHSDPHTILRRFEPLSCSALPMWRYSLQKHGFTAYLDIDHAGYVDDSAHIGFWPLTARKYTIKYICAAW